MAGVCARSAGLTDISPVSSVGQLTQAAYGASVPGQAALNVAAGSVVVKPVPHNVTVADVPAKIVGEAGCAEPSRTMDQMINAIGL